MPRFLVRVQPSLPEMLIDSAPKEDQILGEHFAYLKALADRDVLLVGRTLNADSTSFGIVLLTALRKRLHLRWPTGIPQ